MTLTKADIADILRVLTSDVGTHAGDTTEGAFEYLISVQYPADVDFWQGHGLAINEAGMFLADVLSESELADALRTHCAQR